MFHTFGHASLLCTLGATMAVSVASFDAHAAAAQTRGIGAAFGNTVKSTYPDGRYQRFWLRPDGGWDVIGRRGKPSSGSWTLKGERLCFKQLKPLASPLSYCTVFPRNAGVGAQWAAKDMAGTPIRVSLVKGGAPGGLLATGQ